MLYMQNTWKNLIKKLRRELLPIRDPISKIRDIKPLSGAMKKKQQ